MAKRTKESIDSNVDNLNNITPGETPNNKCPDCGMRFARRSYLAEHASIHNGEKPHVCYYCSKAFTLRCNLVRHVRIHTGEKPFACTICKKTFILKKNMIEHKRTHTGEKPFKCLNCEFTFSRRSSLVRHSRIHSGEKMYECHDCKKTFSWKYYLRRHMSIHLTKKNKKTRRTRKSVGVFVKSVVRYLSIQFNYFYRFQELFRKNLVLLRLNFISKYSVIYSYILLLYTFRLIILNYIGFNNWCIVIIPSVILIFV